MKETKETKYVPEEEVHEFSNTSYLLLLKFIDVLISSIIIAPCVIAYWRGTWELFDLLMLPGDNNTSSLISFAVGCFGHMFFTLCQDSFKNSFDPDKKRLTYYIGSRCYTAIFGLVCVNMWRGVWNLCDNYTSKTSLNVISITTFLAVVALVVIRTTRSLSAPPFAVCVDHKKFYFDISTIFNTEKFQRPGLYVLDTFFSAIVVGTLVVIAWRGVWEIFDLTFYQDDVFISAVGSLIIGYGIVGITFALEPILKRTCRNANGAVKLILADSYYLITFIGAVNVWRGVWILLDVYLFPDNQLKSCYASHAISYVVLTVLNCANSILVRGIAIDGKDYNSSCIESSISYVKLHLQNQRTRKYKEMYRNGGKNELTEKDLLMRT